MRIVAGALLLAITLAGCAEVKHVLFPAPAAPPTRTTSLAPPSAPLGPALPGTPGPTPSAPRPLSRPSPPPPFSSPPTPRVLSPQLEDEQRIEREAQGRIEGTQRLIEKIDQRKLAGDQHQNLSTIQSFVVKAKEALSVRDVQRAFTLADKAYRLAEELSRTVR